MYGHDDGDHYDVNDGMMEMIIMMMVMMSIMIIILMTERCRFKHDERHDAPSLTTSVDPLIRRSPSGSRRGGSFLFAQHVLWLQLWLLRFPQHKRDLGRPQPRHGRRFGDPRSKRRTCCSFRRLGALSCCLPSMSRHIIIRYPFIFRSPFMRPGRDYRGPGRLQLTLVCCSGHPKGRPHHQLPLHPREGFTYIARNLQVVEGSEESFLTLAELTNVRRLHTLLSIFPRHLRFLAHRQPACRRPRVDHIRSRPRLSI